MNQEANEGNFEELNGQSIIELNLDDLDLPSIESGPFLESLGYDLSIFEDIEKEDKEIIDVGTKGPKTYKDPIDVVQEKFDMAMSSEPIEKPKQNLIVSTNFTESGIEKFEFTKDNNEVVEIKFRKINEPELLKKQGLAQTQFPLHLPLLGFSPDGFRPYEISVRFCPKKLIGWKKIAEKFGSVRARNGCILK